MTAVLAIACLVSAAVNVYALLSLRAARAAIAELRDDRDVLVVRLHRALGQVDG